ncbi:MAG: hypothetical protein R3B09_03015 [Nannocystaceae bacterium]
MNHDQTRAVSDLFAELFGHDNDDLVAALRRHPAVDVAFLAGLPPTGNAAPATFQWRVIERLRAHGLIDDELFAALAGVRPAAHGRVAGVARRFGIEVPAPVSVPAPSEGRRRGREPVLLLLSADAEDPEAPLRLGHEQRAILDALARVPERRSSVAFEPQVTYLQAVNAMVRLRPTMTHFGGHGRRGGRVIFAGALEVTPTAMAEIFETLAEAPALVVFMCCDSAEAAAAVSMHVDHVIGFAGELGDRVATAFSAAFYGLLAVDGDVLRTFKLARNTASAEDASAALARLYGRGGVALA